MYVSLTELKKHVNVDFNEDDSYLTGLIEVCEKAVENEINQPLTDLADEGDIPAPVRHAILLLAGNLYENREPVSYGKAVVVPYTISFLLTPYVKLT